MNSYADAISLDDVDKQVLAALQVNARASWGQISRTLKMNESTVARRGQRLFSTGYVRVIGVVDVVRLGIGIPVEVLFDCAPGMVESVAEAVAQHDKVRFAAVVSGRSGCLAELVIKTPDEAIRVIDHELGSIPGVMATNTMFVLNTFSSAHDWGRSLLPNTPELLKGLARPEPTPANLVGTLTPLEARMISHLEEDGRLAYATLAEREGISDMAARRSVESLYQRGILNFRTLIDPALHDYQSGFNVWFDVEPSSLESACRALAAHPDVLYVSAITGSYNIVAQVALRRYQEIYTFLATTVGTLEGVRRVESTIELRVLKRAFVKIGVPAASK
jgi:DNA-binding Lrp family transcriptional regulator